MPVEEAIKDNCIITVGFGTSQFVLPQELANEVMAFIIARQKENKV